MEAVTGRKLDRRRPPNPTTLLEFNWCARAPPQLFRAIRHTVGISDLGESPPHVYAMIQAWNIKGAAPVSSQSSNDTNHTSCGAGFAPWDYTSHMGSPYFTSLPQVLPNLAPISMTGNHGAGFTRAADTNLLYSPTTSLIPSVHPHHQMGPTTAPVNTHLHFGYPNANGSSAQDSTGYSG